VLLEDVAGYDLQSGAVNAVGARNFNIYLGL